MSLIVRRQLVQGPPGKQGPVGPAGAAGIGSESANVVTGHGAVGNGTTDDTAAVQAAANSGRDQVYFPPGTYRVGSVTFSRAKQTITFAPGAVLKLTASSVVLFSGSKQRINGLEYTLATASETTGTVVEVRGAGSKLSWARINVDADVPNATLLKLSGDRVYARDLKLVGQGKSFKYALHIISSDGTEADDVVVDGFDVDVGDDGGNTTYGALVYWRGNRSVIKRLYSETAGRSLFPDGVIIVDGHRNHLADPRILASEAKYGVFRKNLSEFFSVKDGVIQGRANGTFYTDSEGIYSGHFAGHLKVSRTAITGWDWGVGFHGSHDTPHLHGAVIANNGRAAILIDSRFEAGDWPVSGLTISGVYHEEQSVDQEAFLYAKSGALLGAKMHGCLVGYKNRCVYVDPAMTGLMYLNIEGNRLSGQPGEHLTEPGQFSEINVGPNALDGTNSLATGAYAANTKSHLTPALTSASVSTGLTIGTGGDQITRHFVESVTANFASVLTAGTSFELTFTFAEALTSDFVDVSVGGALAAKEGVQFFAWCAINGQVTLRATNTSALNHTSASGAARFHIWRH